MLIVILQLLISEIVPTKIVMNSPKYNRTYHLPWSEGATNDDKIAKDLNILLTNDVVITEKMDGSNTSLELPGCFARTHSGSPTHASFDGLKAFHATVKNKLPEGVQLFGEWLFAKHSISYDKLPNYFLLFNVRSLFDNIWHSWDEVKLWAEEINVPTVPVLFEGRLSTEKELKSKIEELVNQPSACGGVREGVVVRIQEGFTDSAFSQCVMKWVRKDHVQTSDHWKNQIIIKNKLLI